MAALSPRWVVLCVCLVAMVVVANIPAAGIFVGAFLLGWWREVGYFLGFALALWLAVSTDSRPVIALVWLGGLAAMSWLLWPAAAVFCIPVAAVSSAVLWYERQILPPSLADGGTSQARKKSERIEPNLVPNLSKDLPDRDSSDWPGRAEPSL